jgi:CDP-diacylglycerol--glycerol-3-phosphate 3-phosphatidyltransferase
MGSTIRNDIRTLPNIITLSRIVLLWLGVLVYFYVSSGAGIVLAVLAGVTDYLDGYVARRTGKCTRLGEILDQFCDLCFESFVLTIATVRGIVPPYYICIYLFREFWVVCLRRFMAEARVNLPSSLAGKIKTNLIMWGFLPAFLSLAALPEGWGIYFGHAGRIIIAGGLVASYVSAWGYTKAFAVGYADASSRIS